MWFSKHLYFKHLFGLISISDIIVTLQINSFVETKEEKSCFFILGVERIKISCAN